MQKRVLGKGLEALIPKRGGLQAAIDADTEFKYLPVSRIHESSYQPREKIDRKELDELASSIKEKGFIQPVVVRKKGEKFEVVAGSRRINAAKLLGINEIPTIIKELDDKEAYILAITENLQRKNLNPVEEAGAFKRLIDEFGFSLQDLAQFLGKDKSTVVNILRLLKLPPEIQEALRGGIITRSQARTLLALTQPADQKKLFHRMLREGLSVRELEKTVKRTGSKKRPRADMFVQDMEEKLQKRLGTKVRVFHKKNKTGKLIIEYYSLKDLERITKKLL